MLHVSDTAYPRLKVHPTERDLEEFFTPNLAELTFAYKYTRRLGPRVALFVLLKTFQRLGYFVKFAEVPAENIRDEQRKIIKYNHLVANLLIGSITRF
jgi:hypothetical protein